MDALRIIVSSCPTVVAAARTFGPFREGEAYRIPRRHEQLRSPLRRVRSWRSLIALPAAAADAPGSDRLAFALTGGRVIVAPGQVVDPGVVVVRGGVIEAVGPAGSTAIPADARVIDVKGKVVHAAFIDPYASVGPAGGEGRRAVRRTTTSPAQRRGDRGAPRAPRRLRSPAARAEERVIDDADHQGQRGRRLSPPGFRGRRGRAAAGVLRGRGRRRQPGSRIGAGADSRGRGRPVRVARARARRDRISRSQDGRGGRGAPGVPRRTVVARRRGGLRGEAVRARRGRDSTNRRRRSSPRPRAGKSSSSRPTTCWRCCAPAGSRRR